MKTVQMDRNPLAYDMNNPFFPGGNKALRNYIMQAVNEHECYWNHESQVSIQICIDVSGKVFFVNINGSISNQCKSSLVKALYQMPSWIPAYRGPDPVSSELSFSVGVR